MRTVYIRLLDGTIKEFPEDSLWTPPAFYKSGMCKIVTKDMTYVVHSSNIEIISDSEEEVDGVGF